MGYRVKNHYPEYTFDYTLEDDTEGLDNLYWSQFGCKCDKCNVKSGKNYMERLPVYILDDISREERMRFYIDMAYVCKPEADKMPLLSRSSHRIGLGVRVRCNDDRQRLKLVRGLIMRGVSRIHTNNDYIYFDTDTLKPMEFKQTPNNYFGA